jgi:hypothetical protein
MHCSYVYDDEFDLIALTATDGAGRQWTTVLDPDEADQLGFLATGDGRTANTYLSHDQLRGLVIQVTGRDPCQ